MAKSKSGGTARGGKGELLALRSAAIPAHMRATGSVTMAREELESLVGLAGAGYLMRGAGKGDVLANLWLVRAAHEFAAAVVQGGGIEKTDHLAFASHVLLPLSKRIVQAFITDQGMDSIRMDDGGMLVGIKVNGAVSPALVSPMRLNALWYAALEATGLALRGKMPMGLGVKDPSGDHFERLAGRFRRSFAKGHWCDEHDRICAPDVRELPGHGQLPDAEQVLLSLLPASPLPRTKQRGILLQIAGASANALGVWVQHPVHGLVESVVHRAWLVQGFAGLAESDADRQYAATLLRPLATLLEAARNSGVYAFYKDGEPLGKSTDVLATAEVLGTLQQFSTVA